MLQGQGLELEKVSGQYVFDPVCSNCFASYYYDELIEVIDRKSMVNSLPFLFRIAVTNRRPALDLIENQDFDAEQLQAQVSIPLHAFDPDDNNITYIFMSHGPGEGWRENDPEIERNLEKGLLEFRIQDPDDVGFHNIGILALDDSGLYDYQWFWMNISHSHTHAPRDSCVRDCVVFRCSTDVSCPCVNASSWQAGEPYSNHYVCSEPGISLLDLLPKAECDWWCTLATNECRGAPPGGGCGGGDFTSYNAPYASACWDCVHPIFEASSKERHEDCSGREKTDCISRMPDCFWVREDRGSGFDEFCYDDTALNLTIPPAYIVYPD